MRRAPRACAVFQMGAKQITHIKKIHKHTEARQRKTEQKRESARVNAAKLYSLANAFRFGMVRLSVCQRKRELFAKDINSDRRCGWTKANRERASEQTAWGLGEGECYVYGLTLKCP